MRLLFGIRWYSALSGSISDATANPFSEEGSGGEEGEEEDGVEEESQGSGSPRRS